MNDAQIGFQDGQWKPCRVFNSNYPALQLRNGILDQYVSFEQSYGKNIRVT